MEYDTWSRCRGGESLEDLIVWRNESHCLAVPHVPGFSIPDRHCAAGGPTRTLLICPMFTSRLLVWSLAGVVAVVTAIAFAPCVWCGFVNWDDPSLIIENAHIHGWSWSNVWWMFVSFHMGPYQPISWLSLTLDYSMWGLNPIGFHLTNLTIHVATAVLFFLVCRKLFTSACVDSRWSTCSAAFTAMFYSAHPLRVESVAWVSERRDLLAGFFVLCSLWMYLRRTQNEAGSRTAPRWLLLSYVLYTASLLSKANTLGFPAVLTILDIYPLRRLGDSPRDWFKPAIRGVWREKVPYWLLATVIGITAIYGQRSAKAMIGFATYSILDRLAIAGFGSLFYVHKTVGPVALCAFYELPDHLDPWAPRFLWAGVGVIAITVFAISVRRVFPVILAGWLGYLILLAPVSGLAQTGPQLAADRYGYVPCMSLSIIAGAAVYYAGVWLRRIPVAVIAAAVLGLFGILTWKQTTSWENSETLWRQVVRVEPESTGGLALLGSLLGDQGQAEAGLVMVEKAIQLRPTNPDAHSALGRLLLRRGETDSAVAEFLEAVRLRPHSAEFCSTLGGVYSQVGDWQNAAQWFDRSLSNRPDYVPALIGLGRCFEELGALPRAIAVYERATRLEPNDLSARLSLGYALGQAGRSAAAVREYRAAWQLAPHSPDTCYNLAALYIELKEWQSADQWLMRCLQLDPNHDGAAKDVGLVAIRLGRFDRAVEYLERAAVRHPSDVELLDTLAAVYARLGRFDRAVATGMAAVQSARDANNPELAERLERSVERYRNGAVGPPHDPSN